MSLEQVEKSDLEQCPAIHVSGWLNCARRSIRSGEIERAQGYLQQAERYSEDAQSIVECANVKIALDLILASSSLDQATALAEKYTVYYTHSVNNRCSVLLQLSHQHHLQGDMKKAMYYSRQAETYADDWAVNWVACAIHYKRIGMQQHAISVLHKAQQEAHQQLERVDLACGYFHLGESAEALRVMREVWRAPSIRGITPLHLIKGWINIAEKRRARLLLIASIRHVESCQEWAQVALLWFWLGDSALSLDALHRARRVTIGVDELTELALTAISVEEHGWAKAQLIEAESMSKRGVDLDVQNVYEKWIALAMAWRQLPDSNKASYCMEEASQVVAGYKNQFYALLQLAEGWWRICDDRRVVELLMQAEQWAQQDAGKWRQLHILWGNVGDIEAVERCQQQLDCYSEECREYSEDSLLWLADEITKEMQYHSTQFYK
jgi:tetratricopeptide (TPR) repeat protein